jgi:hypothetical protein
VSRPRPKPGRALADSPETASDSVLHEAVRRPALRWYGGKWRLAPWIIRHLPPHDAVCCPLLPRVMGREVVMEEGGKGAWGRCDPRDGSRRNTQRP